MKLGRILEFKQTSLFSAEAEDNLVNDLAKKFLGISRWQIQRVLREMKGILENRTDGNYPHSQLRRWTELALKDEEKGRKSKVTKLSQNHSSKQSKIIVDWRMRSAGEDLKASTFETKR